MQDKEKVTVVVVTQNNASTIKRAIQSVVNGLRPADKVIIGDNDSKDGTYEILCNLLGAEKVTIDGQTGLPPEFRGQFNNIPIHIFKHRETTNSTILNTAIKMTLSETSIFAFMDPTSWYAGDKITQAIAVFNQYPSVACVVSDCDLHHKDGREERLFRPSFDMQRMLHGFHYDNNFILRAQIFPKIKSAFNPQISTLAEYEFLLRVCEVGLIYHIPAPLHHNIEQDIDINKRQEAENKIRAFTIERRKRQNPNG